MLLRELRPFHTLRASLLDWHVKHADPDHPSDVVAPQFRWAAPAESQTSGVSQESVAVPNIALGHPDVCYGEPVLKTVTELTEAVESVL